MRPRAILLAMVTTRKAIHGFAFLSYMSMGLHLTASQPQLWYYSLSLFLGMISTNKIGNVSQLHSIHLPLNLLHIFCCKQDDGPPLSDTEEEEESVCPQEPSENREQVL